MYDEMFHLILISVSKCHFMHTLVYHLNVFYFPRPACSALSWPEAECTLNPCIEPISLLSLPARAADRGDVHATRTGRQGNIRRRNSTWTREQIALSSWTLGPSYESYMYVWSAKIITNALLVKNNPIFFQYHTLKMDPLSCYSSVSESRITEGHSFHHLVLIVAQLLLIVHKLNMCTC